MATYTDPALYRLSEARFRQVIDQLGADSPQRTMLADRRVTRDEVDQAFAQFKACVEEADMTIASAWDPVTSQRRLLSFTPRPGAARAASTAGPTPEDACDEQYWSPVEAIYGADTPSRMDPPLASAMVDCMAGHGNRCGMPSASVSSSARSAVGRRDGGSRPDGTACRRCCRASIRTCRTTPSRDG